MLQGKRPADENGVCRHVDAGKLWLKGVPAAGLCPRRVHRGGDRRGKSRLPTLTIGRWVLTFKSRLPAIGLPRSSRPKLFDCDRGFDRDRSPSRLCLPCAQFGRNHRTYTRHESALITGKGGACVLSPNHSKPLSVRRISNTGLRIVASAPQKIMDTHREACLLQYAAERSFGHIARAVV